MKLNVASILIIEEHGSTANGYQDALEEAGYNVLTVSDTSAAAQALSGIEVDLILLTYERENTTWVENLRQQEHYSDIPVIVTSHIRRQPDVVTRNKGVWFMEKPHRPQQIVTALESTLVEMGAG